MIVTFCGHSEVPDREAVRGWLMRRLRTADRGRGDRVLPGRLWRVRSPVRRRAARAEASACPHPPDTGDSLSQRRPVCGGLRRDGLSAAGIGAPAIRYFAQKRMDDSALRRARRLCHPRLGRGGQNAGLRAQKEKDHSRLRRMTHRMKEAGNAVIALPAPLFLHVHMAPQAVRTEE